MDQKKTFRQKCLVRSLAAVVLYNTLHRWIELLMLPKCVLCAPPNTKQANSAGVAAFSLDRIARWDAGERQSLWADVPKYRSTPGANTKEARMTRAKALAREGLDSKACAALECRQSACTAPGATVVWEDAR